MQMHDTRLSDQINRVRTLPRARTFAPEPEVMPWLHVLGYGLAGVLIVALSIYISLSVYDRYYLAPEPALIPLTPIEIRQQAIVAPYNGLLQHLDRYEGKLLKLNGWVAQVRIVDGDTMLLFSVQEDDITLLDMMMGNAEIVLVRYDGDRILSQGERLHVYGYTDGYQELSLSAGTEMTWPVVDAVLVE